MGDKQNHRIGLAAYNAADPPVGLDMKGLRTDLGKLNGDPPWDGPTNIVMGDGYFARSIEAKYGFDLKTLQAWAYRDRGES